MHPMDPPLPPPPMRQSMCIWVKTRTRAVSVAGFCVAIALLGLVWNGWAPRLPAHIQHLAQAHAATRGLRFLRTLPLQTTSAHLPLAALPVPKPRPLHLSPSGEPLVLSHVGGHQAGPQASFRMAGLLERCSSPTTTPTTLPPAPPPAAMPPTPSCICTGPPMPLLLHLSLPLFMPFLCSTIPGDAHAHAPPVRRILVVGATALAAVLLLRQYLQRSKAHAREAQGPADIWMLEPVLAAGHEEGLTRTNGAAHAPRQARWRKWCAAGAAGEQDPADECEDAESQVEEREEDADALRDWTNLKLETADNRNESVRNLLNDEQGGWIQLQPTFQRGFVWSRKQSSVLIESILLNIDIQRVEFCYSRTHPDRRLTIDGQQRMTSVKLFINNKAPAQESLGVGKGTRWEQEGFSLIGLEKMPDLNGKRFLDLPEAMQRRIKEYSVETKTLPESWTMAWVIEYFKVSTPRAGRQGSVHQGLCCLVLRSTLCSLG